MLWTKKVELEVALLTIHEVCEELTTVTGDELGCELDDVSKIDGNY